MTGTTDADLRLKRARMRAWRRGMREMDLILGQFLDAQGPGFTPDRMTAFEALLERRDADLYAWVADRFQSEPEDAQDKECEMIAEIREFLKMVSAH